MKRSDRRILTTHAGALARPDYLARAAGGYGGPPRDPAGFNASLGEAVAETVAKQQECGIDVVNDGELSKGNFVQYIAQRLTGFESRELAPGEEHPVWWVVRREEQAMGDYFRKRGGVFAFGFNPPAPMRWVSVCSGPVKYVGQDALLRDLDNFKAALAKVPHEEAFLPAPSPGIVADLMLNEHYPSDDAFLAAVAEALREEYLGIVEAGFILQIDSPNTADDWQRHVSAGVPEFRKIAERSMEALNHALRGIDPEKVR
ncbi:MAG: methionine synthase, partial [Chloroflexi bacterium]|nr:methionine synthase [Chloroflexota bacterium]